MTVLTTERLLLRRWRETDRGPFAALNADPEVMEHFPAPLTRAESDAALDRFDALFDTHGYGFSAVEERSTGTFVGFVGLAPVRFEAPFSDPAEIGWRLARSAWGRGYATEAARAALRDGFARLDLPSVVSFTPSSNVRSQAVMQRIGMEQVPGGAFDHPLLPEGHRLSRHVLYRVRPT